MEQLDALIGEWKIEADFGGEPPPVEMSGSTTFEWLPGGKFVIQRWQAPDPAPDGVAIIGVHEGGDTLQQHYFDSRGVARVYEMSLDGSWELYRTKPDFSPLDFWQRFTATLGDDGRTWRGSWQTSYDEGATWEHDFDLIYTKVSWSPLTRKR